MAPSVVSREEIMTKVKDPVSVNGSVEQPIVLLDDKLFVHDLPFMYEVPENVVLTPFSSICNAKVADRTGSFLGFDAVLPRSRHVVSLGKLKDIRFGSLFRFKIWWTTNWVGSNGTDLEIETQLLLLDTPSKAAAEGFDPHPYVLLLPIMEGQFRASLQPGADNYVDVCVESCSAAVKSSSFRSCVYVHAGADPYDLMTDAMRAVRAHLGTFRLLEEKTPPGIVDKFGWCTWDAFYLTVKPQGIWEGVKVLREGGCPPGLVLIDDGWQSIARDEDSPTSEAMSLTVAGDQMPCRLTRFDENYKFKEYVGGSLLGKTADHDEELKEKGMGAFVKDLKKEFSSVEYVYVWHALCGYWGGLRPGTTPLPTEIAYPKLSEGLQTTMKDLAVDKIVNHGIGIVPPQLAHELFDFMHSYLARVGIDGVKIDVIHVLELLCEKFGGRVDLAKAYFKGLSESVKKHLKGNGVIASMEHCNDFMYLGTDQICLGRVGDDFWPCSLEDDPNGLKADDTYWLQGCHMVHCAYNSLWMGQVIQPDWDMFQTTHPCAMFHAASRAISGGPIYVSDKVGQHDFSVLRRTVLPDGTLLRCRHYALPTRDCLFRDPLHDGATMLKIWNLNKYSGVVGAFNCQGGGWDRAERTNKCFAYCSKPVRSTVSTKDVEWYQASDFLPLANVEAPDALFAVYLYNAKKLVVLGRGEGIDLELKPFEFELFTMVPVKKVPEPRGVRFAAVGLRDMLNTGGAVQRVRCGRGCATVEVRGCGDFLAYCSHRPLSCVINGECVEDFRYHEADGSLIVDVPWAGSCSALVEFSF
eukprot:TRINITY_DN25778_c0_g1_i1.p1 TRINITY_DN25778_c0_g1~~TRINITY_DN25778_c0_g1_i1.p1  ORF type:complete len:835 (-),score=-46.09 TRINITY_DN25778_c0_g1_i1:384-2804(-)